MIKMYRWFIGSLMVLAIAFGIWYVLSNYDKQSSVQKGTLVYDQMTDDKGWIWDNAQYM